MQQSGFNRSLQHKVLKLEKTLAMRCGSKGASMHDSMHQKITNATAKLWLQHMKPNNCCI